MNETEEILNAAKRLSMVCSSFFEAFDSPHKTAYDKSVAKEEAKKEIKKFNQLLSKYSK